ncbi:MAG: N-acetylmuramoyl-L-alanine amidase [Bacillota bacterium]
MRRPVFACFLFWFLAFFAGARALAAEERAVRITVDEKPFPLLKAAVYQREPYLALTTMEHLHAETVFDREKGTATIGFGRYTLSLTAGSCEAVFDGRPLRGTRAPVIEEGEFWVPPAWLNAFGLKSSWDEKTGTLALRWTRPYLLRAYLDKTGPEPRLVLEGTSPLRATVFKLVQPDRLVVDLEGCYLYEGLALDERENEYFYRLRAAQNRPGVLRLVADLRQPVGYRVDLAEAGSGRLVILLNRLVFGAEIMRDETGSALVVRTNHRAEWKPGAITVDRFTLEIEPANLVGPTVILPGDGEWFRGISYRQATPDRVVVDVFLFRPGEPLVEHDVTDETKIVVRPTRVLERLAWREDGIGLVLTGNGPLQILPRVERDPNRLVLAIPYAKAAEEEGERPRGAVRRYRVQTVQPGKVEVSLELRYEAQFKLETSSDRRRVEVIFTPPPLAGKTIVLDPGHGGIDPGALGRSLGLREKEVNLDVALRLKLLLEEAGAVVQLTRVDDTYVPLFARAFFANRLPANIFLSIHANSNEDPNINGVEVFYYPGREEARRLAGLILEEMSGSLGLFPRGAKANDFAVLRDSQIVAVLLELAFLSNPTEEAALATESFRSRAAAALARAVIRFVRGEEAKEGAPLAGGATPGGQEQPAPLP